MKKKTFIGRGLRSPISSEAQKSNASRLPVDRLRAVAVESGGDREAMAESKARRLKGHKDDVSCCVASHTRPGIIVTSGEVLSL